METHCSPIKLKVNIAIRCDWVKPLMLGTPWNEAVCCAMVRGW